MLTRKDLMWIGPVQGGNHLELVSHAAIEMGKLPFDIYALGSPTQIVERYLFDVLVGMIIAAKTNIPVEKPFHLFGAGHPFMFSLAVALGCDLFDSAAYAIYARKGKYLTDYGTLYLKDLQYFPCSCKVCAHHTPRELLEMPLKDKEHLLAWHNLQTCFTEIKRIKQAMKQGRLWELLELRARSHPSLFQALKRFRDHPTYLEVGTPTSKTKGLFFFDSLSLSRPEVFRYRDKLHRWTAPTPADILVLLAPPSSKPFHRSKEYTRVFRLLSKKLGKNLATIHFCTYTPPYGVVPLELDETYPLSQFETSLPFDRETVNDMTEQIIEYVRTRNGYRSIIIQDSSILGDKLKTERNTIIGPEAFIISPSEDELWSVKAVNNFTDLIYKAIQDHNS